ncbi:MAG TPA: M28 family peptidase, partial [Thermoanaerobaculia bacterium]|nr:M28 family peptidase [Thermoanaerobaculia bacterium]
EPASEIVDGTLLARHMQGVLAARDPSRYLAQELWRIGLVAGGAKGGWMQPFENRKRVTRPNGRWVLTRGDLRATLPARSVVAALGGRGPGMRVRGLPAVFAGPNLAAPAGALASKVVVVLDPIASAQPGAPAPLPDLLRRAAAARAHAVLVLPRPGATAAIPSPARAAELVAGTGLSLAAWLDETAARDLVRVGLDVPLEALLRLEWRTDVLPLALGNVFGEAVAEVEREPRRNLVAVLPGRGGDEALAVVATLPGARRRGAATSDPRGEAAAAAELLAVATAFQALSDPPRRTVVFAFTDPGDDGLAGARQLVADARWNPPRLAAALVLAGGNLGPPTQEVTFVGARASPLYGLTTRLAALQGRRVVGAALPGRDVIWQSPAWAFLQARVPTVMLEPGVLPRPGPAMPAFGAVVPAAAAAPPPFAGMVEDARLAFRIALELAEGGRPPRVDPAKVEAVLRRPEPPPMVVAPVKPRPRRAVAAIEGAGGIGAPATEAGGDAAAAQSVGPSAPGLSTVPEFVAPPPEGAAPPPIEAPPAARPPSRDESPPQPAPSPSPPQRGR